MGYDEMNIPLMWLRFPIAVVPCFATQISVAPAQISAAPAQISAVPAPPPMPHFDFDDAFKTTRLRSSALVKPIHLTHMLN